MPETPWKAIPILNSLRPTTFVWIEDAEGNPISILDGPRVRLIVHCVNQHDGLVEALQILAKRKCGSWCATPVKDDDPTPRYPNMDDRCASCIARAALAATEGKEPPC